MLVVLRYSGLSHSGLENLFEEDLELSVDSDNLELNVYVYDFASFGTTIASIHLLLVIIKGLA